MIARRSGGVTALTLSLLAGAAMVAITLLPWSAEPPCLPSGLALPSPCQWPLPHLWSAAVALGCMLLLALFAQLLNKRFDFISGTDMVLPAVFFLLMASNPAVSAMFGTPLLLALACLAMLALAMDCYRASNGTQQIFVAASIASAGVMCDAAFILPALWCLPAWGAVKCLRFKELIAWGLGLAAPWWCALGTGLIPLGALDAEPLARWLTFPAPTPAQATQIGMACWWAFAGMIIGLNTAVKLYAGNSRTRCLNNAVTLLGLAGVAGMALDSTHLTAFLGIFYFSLAVQVAQMFALWQIPRARLWLSVVMLLIAAQFPLLMLL